MAGLAGWCGLEVENAGAVADAMRGALSRFDGANGHGESGAGWALSAARQGSAPLIHTEGSVTGVLFGDLRGPLAEARNPLQTLCARYARGDTGFLADLQGVFALALLRPEAQRALIAADRVGIVPMYFWHQGNTLAFSNRLPALYELPAVPLELDHQAVYSYLYFHAIPAPQTIYRDIRRLTPGTALELRDSAVHEVHYWQPTYTDERGNAGVPELKPGFRAAVEQSVQQELQLGQRVGCFLSGGTDSSTVAGHLAKFGEGPAQTFSIGFDQEGYDETGFARLAAKHFATEHQEYYVTPSDIVELIPRLAGYYGTPFGNSSVIPTYYCARLAKSHGIDRILGGDGGDELFGGNDRYAKQKVFGLYDYLPDWFKGGLLEPAVGMFPFGDKVMPVRKARRYIEQAKVPMPERMEAYNLVRWFENQGLFEPDFQATIDPAQPLRQQAQVYDNAQCSTMMNRMLALDLKFTLADNDIPKVSGMCELAGVEVGYPFMSDQLVEFSTRVPIELKVKRLRLRHLFKEALRDFLPEEVINKSKHGFGLPFGLWAANDPGLRTLVSDSMSDFKGRGIVSPAFIDRIIAESRGEDAHFFGGLVWVFMVLEQWFAERQSNPRSASRAN